MEEHIHMNTKKCKIAQIFSVTHYKLMFKFGDYGWKKLICFDLFGGAGGEGHQTPKSRYCARVRSRAGLAATCPVRVDDFTTA